MFPWTTNPWMVPLWGSGSDRAPLSGDVHQAISPRTAWFSPQFDVRLAGDPAIEREVVETVASYGTQIGHLTDAVLALAGDAQDSAVVRLRETAEAVDEIKNRRRGDALRAAEAALTRLRDNDPEAFVLLLDRYKG